MARLPDLVAFAQKHGLKIGTISDLIRYRRRYDNLIAERASRIVHSAHGGEWIMRIFADEMQGAEHIVLSKGDLTAPGPVLVRMHALDPLHDVLGIGGAGAGSTSLPPGTSTSTHTSSYQGVRGYPLIYMVWYP